MKNNDLKVAAEALKDSIIKSVQENKGPKYRKNLFLSFLPNAKDSVMLETERGISGQIILGSAEIWNKEEFFPWLIRDHTIVLGNLTVEGKLIIDGGFLYVAKNIVVEEIHIVNGEVYCAGDLKAKEKIIKSKVSFLFSESIASKEMDLLGDVDCSYIYANN